MGTGKAEAEHGVRAKGLDSLRLPQHLFNRRPHLGLHTTHRTAAGTKHREHVMLTLRD